MVLTFGSCSCISGGATPVAAVRSAPPPHTHRRKTAVCAAGPVLRTQPGGYRHNSRSVAVAAGRRRLFGGGGGGAAPDGSSGSSSDDDSWPGTTQDSQQQQQEQQQQQQVSAAAAAAAERARKRQDALRRLRLSTRQLQQNAERRPTGSAMLDAALQQHLMQRVAGDAADILAASPSTLQQQLAMEGADLEADWAEAEAASAAALTTTGRAKDLAAKAAALGLAPSDILNATRPLMRPQALPYAADGDDDFEDDDWSDILDADDLPFWGGDDYGTSASAGSGDPVAAAAAAVRKQLADPGFQAWLEQQQRQKAQKAAQAAKQKELERKLQASGAAVERLRKQQAAAEFARLNSQLQQQQQQLLNRPAARPQQGSSAGDVGWEDDVITDPSNVPKSDVGLTPAQMAALLDDMGISSSSSSSRGLQAPVLQPKQGYSFSSGATAASSRLAAASASGQLQRPLLVRPAARPTGTAGSNPILDQPQYWDESEAAAAAAAQAEAQRKAFVAGLLATQQQQQQQQKAQQQQRSAGPVPTAQDLAAAERLRKAAFNSQLSRPARPGAPAAATAASSASGAAAAASKPPQALQGLAAAGLQRPQLPPQQQQQQQQDEPVEYWDAEEAAAAKADKAEADRRALLTALQAQVEANSAAAAAGASSSSAAAAAAAKKKPAARSSTTASISSTPAAQRPLQGLKRPAARPVQQQQQAQAQQQQQPQAQKKQQKQQFASSNASSAAPAAAVPKPQLPVTLPLTPKPQALPLKRPARPAAAAASAAAAHAADQQQLLQQQGEEEEQLDAWDAEEAAAASKERKEAAFRAWVASLTPQQVAAALPAAKKGKLVDEGTKGPSNKQQQGVAAQLQQIPQSSLLPGLQKPPTRPVQPTTQRGQQQQQRPKQQQQRPKQQQQQREAGEKQKGSKTPKQSSQSTSSKQQDRPQQQQRQKASKQQGSSAATAEVMQAAAAAAAAAADLLDRDDVSDPLVQQLLGEALDALGEQQQQQQEEEEVPAATAPAKTQKQQAAADPEAVLRRLQQASAALEKAAASRQQLQRPTRPVAAASSKARSSSSSAAAGSSTSRSVPPNEQYKPAGGKASEAAVDWRFAAATGGSKGRHSGSSSTAGSGNSSNSGGSSSSSSSSTVEASRSKPARAKLPRTIPEDKLHLAEHLERTRTPTTALVRGVQTSPSGHINLIVELSELGCVTLLPLSQLLPSQQAALVADAEKLEGSPAAAFQGQGLSYGGRGARFPGGRPLMDFFGVAGEKIAAALQEWKGRQLDVIVAGMPHPVFVARQAPTHQLRPQLKRFNRAFWPTFTRLCYSAVKEVSLQQASEAGPEQRGHSGSSSSSGGGGGDGPAGAGIEDKDPLEWGHAIEEATAETLAIAESLAEPLLSVLDVCVPLPGPTGNPATPEEEGVAATSEGKIPWCGQELLLQQALLRLAAANKLPPEAAEVLLQPPHCWQQGAAEPHTKYVRCVAVATWPPAWQQQQQRATGAEQELEQGTLGSGAQKAAAAEDAASLAAGKVSSSSGSNSGGSSGSIGSSSGSCLWVAEAAQVLGVSAGEAGYTAVDTLLLTSKSGDHAVPSEFSMSDDKLDAQVVGVHPAGYLLCQVRVFVGAKAASDSQLIADERPTTIAVPLSLAPHSMQLRSKVAAAHQGQQQQTDSGEASAGEQQTSTPGLLSGVPGSAGGPDDLGLWAEHSQQRWCPWNLQADATAPAAAAAAAAAADGSAEPESMQQQAQGSGTNLGGGQVLSAAELQSWRQGVLGLWRQPYMKVQLQLLPLDQQQDPSKLKAAWMECSADRRRAGVAHYGPALYTPLVDRVSTAVEGSGGRREAGFGTAPCLLLLGGIVVDDTDMQ